jgi:hypothetical protein
MKSIIRNRNKWIRKNNKRHCLYYSYSETYYFCRWQENKLHRKKTPIAYENKQHNYYNERSKYVDYSFNNYIT